ncbi:MAG: helix-turn-helix domain-containing protein [Acidobacteriota bacterium]
MPKATDAKLQALRQQACLNLRSDQLNDELFRDSEFFDPRDLVQVKYEMLRRVQKDGHPVSQAAATFGFSRPSFYQAQAAFEQAGLVGLIPHKRGPKQGHKLTQEVVDFIQQKRHEDPSLRTLAIVDLIAERFQIVVHPRSIERGLARHQKKRRKSG